MKVDINYKSRNGKYNVGAVFRNKRGDCAKVIGRVSESSGKNAYYRIQFLNTGTIIDVESGNLNKGNFKDYQQRSVYGVGYMGFGDNKSYKNGRHTKEYKLWARMIERCYGGHERNSAYAGVIVCDRWHCFQDFCDDLPMIDGYDEWTKGGMEIDKDILGDGSRYDLESCKFVTKSENIKEMNSRYKKIIKRDSRGRILSTVTVPSESR